MTDLEKRETKLTIWIGVYWWPIVLLILLGVFAMGMHAGMLIGGR